MDWQLIKLIFLGFVILGMLGFLATAHIWMVPKEYRPRRRLRDVHKPLTEDEEKSDGYLPRQ